VPKIRVLICDTVSEKGVKMLCDAGFDVTYTPKITKEDLLTTIPDYEAVVVRSRTKVTREVISAAKQLKVIGRAGAGLDNVDRKAAEESNIKVYNTPDALTNAVSELVIGLILSLSRGICLGDAGVKRGEWPKSSLLGKEVKGKTLGVVGLGRIGRRVAEIADALGMDVLYYDIINIPDNVVKQLNIRFRDIDTLLSESDFVTIHVPLTPTTKHFISREKIAKMKKGAYLINASRGAVLDEKALLDALNAGHIQGAALDVFEIEPPGKNELTTHPNVVCTPHIGAQTLEAQEIAATGIAEKIIEYFKTTDVGKL
jgi:D-3-phosphoglycerate dehydrogenase